MADSTRPSEEDKQESLKLKRREYARAYYIKNKDRIQKKNKAWISANKKRHKECCRKRRASNKEKDRKRQLLWRQQNPDKAAAAQKRYRDSHGEEIKARRDAERDKLRARSRDHYQRNKESYAERRRRYRQQNKPALSQRAKRYYAENKDAVLERHKQWRANNRESILLRQREYDRTMRNQSPSYSLKKSVSRRMRDVLASRGATKGGRSMDLVGCDGRTLIKHIESLFAPGMTWENYGYRGWHIDHIVPLAKFDLRDPHQQSAAFHYTNLQPLWAEDNMRKKDKVTGQNLFGFAYAAKIEGTMSKVPKKRRKHGG